jgi:hypothetical protein
MILVFAEKFQFCRTDKKKKKGCGSSKKKELPYHVVTDTAAAVILTAFASTGCVFARVCADNTLSFLF